MRSGLQCHAREVADRFNVLNARRRPGNRLGLAPAEASKQGRAVRIGALGKELKDRSLGRRS